MTILLFSLTLLAGPGATLESAASFTAAQSEARRSERDILVHFHTSWCGWCRRMEKLTYADERVIERSAREFVFVALDAEAEGEVLADQYRVRSYPTAVLLTVDGAELGRIQGFRKVESFLSDLDAIAQSRKALESLLASRERAPGDAQLTFDLAMSLDRAKRYQEALRLYRELADSKSVESAAFRDLALWNMASLHDRLDEPELALESYRRFVDSYPDAKNVEKALYQIGRIEQSLGRHERALATYRDFLRRFPRSRHAARVRMQIERVEAADQ